jgi:hypothetical protein
VHAIGAVGHCEPYGAVPVDHSAVSDRRNHRRDFGNVLAPNGRTTMIFVLAEVAAIVAFNVVSATAVEATWSFVP